MVTWIRLSDLEELAEDGRSTVPALCETGRLCFCAALLFCGQLCVGSVLAAEQQKLEILTSGGAFTTTNYLSTSIRCVTSMKTGVSVTVSLTGTPLSLPCICFIGSQKHCLWDGCCLNQTLLWW